MSVVSAQISLYPLREPSLGPAIRDTIRIFREHNLEIQIGAMSTLVWGEEAHVFSALQAAFHKVAERSDTVMVVTFSNACPLPERP